MEFSMELPNVAKIAEEVIQESKPLTEEEQASVDRELILKNAPCRNSEMFIAPKTIE